MDKPVAAEKLCEACSAPFVPNKPWQRYCNDRCRDDYWRLVRQLAKIAARNRLGART